MLELLLENRDGSDDTHHYYYCLISSFVIAFDPHVWNDHSKLPAREKTWENEAWMLVHKTVV